MKKLLIIFWALWACNSPEPDPAPGGEVVVKEETVVTSETEKEEKEDSKEPAAEDWTVKNTSKEHATKATAILKNIKTATHKGYQRVVVEFENEIPSYNIEYIDKPAYQCGSGEPFYPEGDALLQIKLHNAAAHTEEGTATLSREMPVNEMNIRKIVIGCDFEAEVVLWLDMGAPQPYKVMELANPARLVVDIKE